MINKKDYILKKIEHRRKGYNFLKRNKNQKNIEENMLTTEDVQIKKPEIIVKDNNSDKIINKNRNSLRFGGNVSQKNIFLDHTNKTSEKYDINNKEVLDYIKIFDQNIIRTNLKILFLISNYERYDMLTQILNEIDQFSFFDTKIDYLIFDDVSSYVLNDERFIINEYHRGKEEYWKTFDEIFKKCKELDYDIFIFSPNDFLKYDLIQLIKYSSSLFDKYFVFNIINDGRDNSWNGNKNIAINDEIYRSFFTDCGFFTNKKTLESLGFEIFSINKSNFTKNINLSSGVGRQLTYRLNNQKIPIFIPQKSLAHHGDHDSLMHYELRKKEKIISI